MILNEYVMLCYVMLCLAMEVQRYGLSLPLATTRLTCDMFTEW